MPRFLLLVRHAHRDTSLGRELDNGLSPKGVAQAQLLGDYLSTWITGLKLKPRDISMISSPALRCLQTIEPLSKKLGTKMSQDRTTLEGTGYLQRALKFWQTWLAPKGKSAKVTVLCSHGDFLPAVLGAAIGSEIALKKGAFAIIELKTDGAVWLRELRQRLK